MSEARVANIEGFDVSDDALNAFRGPFEANPGQSKTGKPLARMDIEANAGLSDPFITTLIFQYMIAYFETNEQEGSDTVLGNGRVDGDAIENDATYDL